VVWPRLEVEVVNWSRRSGLGRVGQGEESSQSAVTGPLSEALAAHNTTHTEQGFPHHLLLRPWGSMDQELSQNIVRMYTLHQIFDCNTSVCLFTLFLRPVTVTLDLRGGAGEVGGAG